MGYVYLIHFDSKLAHAQHYIGYTTNVPARMEVHRKATKSNYRRSVGNAKIIAVVNDLGITWRLARVWLGNQNFEKLLKGRHNGGVLCPVCNPDRWRDNYSQIKQVKEMDE